MTTPDPAPDARAADRVVLSYPEDVSEWGRDALERSSFRAFLRKTRDSASVGDTWEEFVGVGCCGNTLDIPLRVEAVDGSDRMGGDTEIEFAVREACSIDGGWRVQSEDGPRQ